ncbi:CTD kinase subunit gamma CTK3-domain-containing protein [Biscogniauxia mediterranea]|nr:CTD kinase subunit gamma CTK3-domain-containing protein [Biscogniauxia mediterranea]
MADPFEVRMRFSSQLQHLNASTTSSQKAAQYALKYKDMDEDLHSCILEQLEKTSMNTRANIMYFIEHLLEMASKEHHNEYVRMMQRDIIRVVDAVCPEDGSGAANVKVVRKVILGLKNKYILLDQTVVEIEGCLKERDTSAVDLGLSSPANGDDAGAAGAAMDLHVTSRPRNGATSGVAATGNSGGAGGGGSAVVVPNRLDKRQIEQRIEEDRERHKRMRENMWLVPQDLDAEARQFLDNTSDVGEDDHRLGEEERCEFRDEYEDAECRHLRRERERERAGPNGVIGRHEGIHAAA